MRKKIRLSVVIVNYNTRELVQKCIASIKSSVGLTFGIKIIVVDNASTDGSAALLQRLAGITFIQAPANLGFSRGNNLAIPELVGEYVWFLNPDTQVEPNTINFMVTYLDTHPDVGVATPKLVLPDGRFDPNCHRAFPGIWNTFCHFSGLGKLFPTSKLFSGYYLGYLPVNQECEVDVVGGSSLLTRTSLAKQVGWWDEDYFMYGEDIEFTYRVKQLGFKVMYVPNAFIYHYHGAASGLKKSSSHVTTADYATRKRSLLATTNAMRIFFRKHHEPHNSRLTNRLVHLGIFLLERYRLLAA